VSCDRWHKIHGTTSGMVLSSHLPVIGTIHFFFGPGYVAVTCHENYVRIEVDIVTRGQIIQAISCSVACNSVLEW
jgi:hypothetical protein